jgi:hypothetical protein
MNFHKSQRRQISSIILSDLSEGICGWRMEESEFQFDSHHHCDFLVFLHALPSLVNRERRIENQGNPRGDRMLDSGGQRDVAQLDGTRRDINGNIGCNHAVYSPDMLCHAGSEYLPFYLPQGWDIWSVVELEVLSLDFRQFQFHQVDIFFANV